MRLACTAFRFRFSKPLRLPCTAFTLALYMYILCYNVHVCTICTCIMLMWVHKA